MAPFGWKGRAFAGFTISQLLLSFSNFYIKEADLGTTYSGFLQPHSPDLI